MIWFWIPAELLAGDQFLPNRFAMKFRPGIMGLRLGLELGRVQVPRSGCRFSGRPAELPELRKKKGGVILNMASVAALSGIADRFAYSTSKGAVLAMTMSVAKDYVQENIRCNSVSPARVHTPFVDGFLKKSYPGKEAEMFEKLSKTQPIGRMAKPEEVAALALYLCSDEASFITGCDYPIDGGFVKLNN